MTLNRTLELYNAERNYSSIPDILKLNQSIPYENLYTGAAVTNGSSINYADGSGSFTLSQDVIGARIYKYVNTTNPDVDFSDASAAIINYPYSPAGNPDCLQGDNVIIQNPYSNTTTYECVKDLKAGTYTTAITARSYGGLTASAHLIIDAPVAQTYTVNIGGLRIKKITFIESGTQTSLIKKFDYTNPEQSHLRFLPAFLSKVQRNTADAFACYGCFYPELYTLHAASVSSVPGYHIEYPKVTEFNGENGEGGKTDHYFSQSWYLGAYMVAPFPSPLQLSWRGGLETKRDIYKNSIGSQNKISSDSTQYEAESYIAPPDISLKVGIKDMNYCFAALGYPGGFDPGNDAQASIIVGRSFNTADIPMFTENFSLKQTSKLQINADPNSIIEKKLIYTYNGENKLLPSKTEEYSNNGKIIESLTTYPEDLILQPAPGSLDAAASGISNLLAENIKSAPIEILNLVNDSGDKKIIDGKLYVYNSNTVTVKEIYEINLNSPLPLNLFQKSSVDQNGVFNKDSRYRLISSILKYDNYNNPLEILNHKKGVKEGYKWGYGQQYPVAECTNASDTEFLFEDFEGNGSISANTNESHSGKGSYSGNIILSNYFNSSLNGRLYTLSYFLKNGTSWEYITTSYTGQTISGTIDDIRIYPTDGQITTYTYNLLVGLTSQTDPKGMTTFYEYDDFQRLKYIKDQQGNIVKSYDYHYKP